MSHVPEEHALVKDQGDHSPTSVPDGKTSAPHAPTADEGGLKGLGVAMPSSFGADRIQPGPDSYPISDSDFDSVLDTGVDMREFVCDSEMVTADRPTTPVTVPAPTSIPAPSVGTAPVPAGQQSNSPLPFDATPPGAPRMAPRTIVEFLVDSRAWYRRRFPTIYPTVQWGSNVSPGHLSAPASADVGNGSNVFDHLMSPANARHGLVPPAPRPSTSVRRCRRTLPGIATAKPAAHYNADANGGRPVAVNADLGGPVLQATARSTNSSPAGSSPTTDESPPIVTPAGASPSSPSDLAIQRARQADHEFDVDHCRASPDRNEQQAAFAEVIKLCQARKYPPTWLMVLAKIQSVRKLPLDHDTLKLFWALYDQYRDQLANADDLNGRSTLARDYHICEPTSEGWFGRDQYGESLNAIYLEWALATGGGPFTSPNSPQFLLGSSIGFNRPPDQRTVTEPTDGGAARRDSLPSAMSPAHQQAIHNPPVDDASSRPPIDGGHTGTGPAPNAIQPRDPALGAGSSAGPPPGPVSARNVGRGSNPGAAPACASSEEAVAHPGPNGQPHEEHRESAGSPDSGGSRVTRNSRSSRGSSGNGQQVQGGDFFCLVCRAHNFRKNPRCRNCQAAPGPRVPYPPPGARVKSSPRGHDHLILLGSDGDRRCPACGKWSWRRRLICFACDGPLPADGYPRPGEYCQPRRFPHGRHHRPRGGAVIPPPMGQPQWRGGFGGGGGPGPSTMANRMRNQMPVPYHPHAHGNPNRGMLPSFPTQPSAPLVATAPAFVPAHQRAQPQPQAGPSNWRQHPNNREAHGHVANGRNGRQ